MTEFDISCPLCETHDVERFYRDSDRDYLLCNECALVFVPPVQFLSMDAEREHYGHHNNDPRDARYRKFLSRLADPMMRYLAIGSQGLDFGCGPGPTLSLMLAEQGYPTAIYDPAFQPCREVWAKRYDFITASEVVEHLHRPRFELERLWSRLNNGGVLGIMTKRRFEVQSFADWHYKSDPTHVIFFSDDTFRWIARWLGAEPMFVGPDVVLLRKDSVTQ